MASSKTLIDFLQPTKRLKVSNSLTSQAPLQLPNLIKVQSLSNSSHGDDHLEDQTVQSSPSLPSSSLTAEQKLKVGLRKSLARSKMNLRVCNERLIKSQAEGVNFVGLEKLLVEETWVAALPGELQKPYVHNLSKFVEREVCSEGPIYPPLHLVFNALNTTPFDEVKVVILGQDPYHGPGQAMGLSFSVPEGVRIPTSLANIFKELKQDLECSIPSHGNLVKWAVQGVLLLNTVLTVKNHSANSHAKKGWEEFTDAIIRTISEKRKGVVFLLWGLSAQAKARLIDHKRHHILKAAHPSGLSAHRGFFGCRHFSQTNRILEQMGSTPIDWQL